MHLNGYAQVSTTDQDLTVQEEKLCAAELHHHRGHDLRDAAAVSCGTQVRS
jgi:hypothetical protein